MGSADEHFCESQLQETGKAWSMVNGHQVEVHMVDTTIRGHRENFCQQIMIDQDTVRLLLIGRSY